MNKIPGGSVMSVLKLQFIYFVLLVLVFDLGTSEGQSHQISFKPGEIWPDDSGVHINAHGGGFLFYGGVYYWFGEHKEPGRSNRAEAGVHVYASSDLYNWEDKGIAFAVVEDTTSLIRKGTVIERPKVIYNKKTEKFIMWFHHELYGQGYDAALIGVAIADEITGPYEYVESLRPHAEIWPQNFLEEQKNAEYNEEMMSDSDYRTNAIREGYYTVRDFEGGQMSRDMTLFVDDDGTAYHIAATEENYTLMISELNEEYTGFTERWIRLLPGGHNEAPAIFKKDGIYYMIMSGATGWTPNAARSAKAGNMFGPWKSLGNPARGTVEQVSTTFESQSTFILRVEGKEDAFIYMGDRWRPNNHIDGRYIWLPIEFEENRPVIRWHDEWDLSVFN